MADYDALRQQVEADAGDFTSWSKLLAAVEEGATAYPERVAPTFESFLAKFPLCFGYWCKYADLQRRLGEAGSVDAAEAQADAVEDHLAEFWPSGDFFAFLPVATSIAFMKSVN